MIAFYFNNAFYFIGKNGSDFLYIFMFLFLFTGTGNIPRIGKKNDN